MRRKLKVQYRKAYRKAINKKKRIYQRKRIIILACLIAVSAILYGLININNIRPEKNSSIYTIPENAQDGDLLFPAEGSVTALSKIGTHENNGAVDIANSEGTPIIAAMDGKVIFADVKGTYGNCIIIEHAHHLSTVYAHLSQIDVTTHEAVKRGQVIGKMGCTGNSTGNHLHFEVRVNGQRQNVLKYFPFLKVNLDVIREKK